MEPVLLSTREHLADPVLTAVVRDPPSSHKSLADSGIQTSNPEVTSVSPEIPPDRTSVCSCWEDEAPFLPLYRSF